MRDLHMQQVGANPSVWWDIRPQADCIFRQQQPDCGFSDVNQTNSHRQMAQPIPCTEVYISSLEASVPKLAPAWFSTPLFKLNNPYIIILFVVLPCLTSTDMLVWMSTPLNFLYWLNCLWPSSTVWRSISPRLASSVVTPSLGIARSASTQESNLGRLPRTLWKRQQQKRMREGKLRTEVLDERIVMSITTKGSRHSCWLLMANTLRKGSLQGPFRLQTRVRKLSRASQRTERVSDHHGGIASMIKTRAGCRRNVVLEKPELFLWSMSPENMKTKNGFVLTSVF